MRNLNSKCVHVLFVPHTTLELIAFWWCKANREKMVVKFGDDWVFAEWLTLTDCASHLFFFFFHILLIRGFLWTSIFVRVRGGGNQIHWRKCLGSGWGQLRMSVHRNDRRGGRHQHQLDHPRVFLKWSPIQ